ncbi:MFS transporter [Paenibacillus sp. LS1]|uniref:MFS transporter n=1 Tax=Paenibacillus sp. LS1 TaxID=2992120 RepID=UPI00223053B5|nr:MFS transporter [Paenibacillus sp. LS1]MCW3795188.1 MFS transporter [Paenibacillus sp. LS1]
MEIFKNKNFSLMFFGRILTNIGDSLYAVSAMWLVYNLGGSSFYTGLAGFLSILPKIIQLLSGPMIDRLPIRGILVYSQLIQALLLLIVPIAAYYDFLSVGLVLVITPILNICNTWVYPVQMSALPRVLEKHQLTQGNSLFSIAYQGIDVACNAISGILIVALGAVSLYFWNAIGFFIGALLFSQLRIAPYIMESKMKKEQDTYDEIIERVNKSTPSGMRLFFRNYTDDLVSGIMLLTRSALAKLLFGIMVINAAGGATFSVLPIYSDEIGGAGIYGLMLMAQALGSVIGATCAPYLRLENVRLGRLYSVAYIISGIAWIGCIFTPWSWLSILVYGLAWVPGGAVNVIINTVVQKGVPQQYLGLVFSATMALSGIAMPIGSLIGGTLGVWLQSSTVITLCGITVVLVGVYWMFDRVSRNLPKTEQLDEGYFNFTPRGGKARSNTEVGV